MDTQGSIKAASIPSRPVAFPACAPEQLSTMFGRPSPVYKHLFAKPHTYEENELDRCFCGELCHQHRDAKYPLMSCVASRKNTFRGHWHKAYPKPENFWKCGFFVPNDRAKEDTVVCAFCGIRLSDWDMFDTPEGEHKRWSPNCTFVRHLEKRAPRRLDAVIYELKSIGALI